MDIGSAEGFFSDAALSVGASKVIAVNPAGLLLARFRRVMRMKHPTRDVESIEGFFPNVGTNELARVDIVLALGVIYHAMNCEEFMAPLLAIRKPLWIEVATELHDNPAFDPVHHNDSRDQQFSVNWLEGKLEASGFELLRCDEYNKRCDIPGYLTPSAADRWTRRAFIAFPKE